MAGVGPAPKEGRRQRRTPLRGEWVDLEPLAEPVLPEEPEVEGVIWSARTMRTWRAWRADPVSALWTSADVEFATDTILLHNEMSPKIAAELRLRMDALGLTPKGKRDLRWRPKQGDAAPATVTKLPQQERRLRAV